jgi:flagellin-like hook-associated protein FlgL
LNVNSDLRISAVTSGTSWNGVALEVRDTLSGNVAAATYDPVGRRLILDIADGRTTANTAIAAILAEGTFTAELDMSRDPTNDGTGILVAPTGVAATTGGGTAEILTGRDVNPLETEGVFNSLVRLRNAVATNDVESMQRIVEMLDADHDRLTFGRATLGTRTEGLEAIQARNQDDQVQLQSTLSNEIDMDLAEAITEFSARQAAYEASLRTIGNMFQLSLLDFL